MRLFEIRDELHCVMYIVASSLNNALIKFNAYNTNRIIAIQEITSNVLIGD